MGEVPQHRNLRSQLEIFDRNQFRKLFTGKDNLDWLLYAICIFVRDHIFPTCPSADPIDLKQVLIKRIGEELRNAILQKLKQYFPKDAHRQEALLLEYYPDRAVGLLQQALGHLTDLWVKDMNLHRDDKDDTLVMKCQRLLPSLSFLPDLRGKSALGTTSRLFGLVVYNDVRTLLKDLPRTKRKDNWTHEEERRRKQYFSDVFVALKNNLTSLSPPPPPAIKKYFSEAASNNYKDWIPLSRTEIALDIVAKITKQKPDTFLHAVSQLHMEALPLAIKTLKPTL